MLDRGVFDRLTGAFHSTRGINAAKLKSQGNLRELSWKKEIKTYFGLICPNTETFQNSISGDW